MNEKPDWELVDDEPQPKQRFSQSEFSGKNFLYTMLGKYPRLKLAGMATVGIMVVAVITLFSLIALAGATVASVLILFVAWCKAKFVKDSKSYNIHIFGK